MICVPFKVTGKQHQQQVVNSTLAPMLKKTYVSFTITQSNAICTLGVIFEQGHAPLFRPDMKTSAKCTTDRKEFYLNLTSFLKRHCKKNKIK